MTDWLNKTHIGDCRELLGRMAADGVKVQTCVTSPPYFGLRDYGTGQWEGGDSTCQHTGSIVRTGPAGSPKQASNTGALSICSGDCACGARRVDQQIGLEPSPAEYVDQLVGVFRAVREVLADDGTLWLNLGDSYSSNAATGRKIGGESFRGSDTPTLNTDQQCRVSYRGQGIKPKDLIGIPWSVAFALRADGWYLRSDIIWHKPSPMPESVTDRPTKAHEYLFLLAKSERYYFDVQAISEPCSYRTEWTYPQPDKAARAGISSNGTGKSTMRSPRVDGNRNRRSVWTVPTEPFSGAHFATFPRKLIEPCILAGCPPGGTVLDPFMGSGTTGQVSTDLGRNYIGCELNPAYVALHEMRSTTIGMPL